VEDIMDVLDGEVEQNPWKTSRSRWSAAKMKIWPRSALDNGGFWWRWRV